MKSSIAGRATSTSHKHAFNYPPEVGRARLAMKGKARELTYTSPHTLFFREEWREQPPLRYSTGLELNFICRHALIKLWPFGTWSIWFGDTCVGSQLSCPSYTDCLRALATWRGERSGRMKAMAASLQHAEVRSDTMTVGELLTPDSVEPEPEDTAPDAPINPREALRTDEENDDAT